MDPLGSSVRELQTYRTKPTNLVTRLKNDRATTITRRIVQYFFLLTGQKTCTRISNDVSLLCQALFPIFHESVAATGIEQPASSIQYRATLVNSPGPSKIPLGGGGPAFAQASRAKAKIYVKFEIPSSKHETNPKS
jgi:hypothetical protein